MANQMAQTPVTLNDPEGHFSYLKLFNSLIDITRINFDMCTRIREHTWPVTLNEFEGHSLVSGLFKCKSSTFVQQFTRFQLARPRRAVPQRQLGFLSISPSVT